MKRVIRNVADSVDLACWLTASINNGSGDIEVTCEMSSGRSISSQANLVKRIKVFLQYLEISDLSIKGQYPLIDWQVYYDMLDRLEGSETSKPYFTPEDIQLVRIWMRSHLQEYNRNREEDQFMRKRIDEILWKMNKHTSQASGEGNGGLDETL
jgi:hypothetical protein